MAENRTFLVSKYNLPNFANNGKVPENARKNEKPRNQLYISVAETEDRDSQTTTSPSENMSVYKVVDTVNNKTAYSADTVKAYSDLKKKGKMPRGYKIDKEPVGEFLEKQFKEYELDFKKAIQARDNSNLDIVIAYLVKAHQSNNQVALGMMAELIKMDPNYDFVFSGGAIDINKLLQLNSLDKVDIKKGFDQAEKLEYMRMGGIDASALSAKDINKLADYEFEPRLGKELKEEEIIVDRDFEKAQDEQDTQKASEKAKENLTSVMARMIEKAKSIRDDVAKQRAQRAIEEGQKKSEQALDNRVRSGLARLSGIRRENEDKGPEDRDNNSLANLFKRSSLSNEATNKDDAPKQTEDRAREERAKLLEQRELEKAKKREADGKKLTPYQQELLDRDREERIRIADEKMKQGRTIDNTVIKDEKILGNLNSAGIAVGRRVGEKTNEEPQKDDEGR